MSLSWSFQDTLQTIKILSLLIIFNVTFTEYIPISCDNQLNNHCSNDINLNLLSRDCQFLYINYEYRSIHESITNITYLNTLNNTLDIIGSCNTKINPLYIDNIYTNLSCNELYNPDTFYYYLRSCFNWYTIWKNSNQIDSITLYIDQYYHSSTNKTISCSNNDNIIGYLHYECIQKSKQDSSLNIGCLNQSVSNNMNIDDIMIIFSVNDNSTTLLNPYMLYQFNISILCDISSIIYFNLYTFHNKSNPIIDNTNILKSYPMECDKINNISFITLNQDIINKNNIYFMKDEYYVIHIVSNLSSFNISLCRSYKIIENRTNIEIIDIYYNNNILFKLPTILSLELYRPNISIPILPSTMNTINNKSDLEQLHCHILYKDEDFTYSTVMQHILIFEESMKLGLNILMNHVLINESYNEYRNGLWDIINLMEGTIHRIEPKYFDFGDYFDVKLTEFHDVPIEKEYEVIDNGWHYDCNNLSIMSISKECVSLQAIIYIMDINDAFQDIMRNITIDLILKYEDYVEDIIANKYNHSFVEIFSIELLSQKWVTKTVIINDKEKKDKIVIPQYVSYFIYGFIGLCVLLAIFGFIHAICIGADNIRISGCIYFALYTFDFYSDIIFSLEILNIALISDTNTIYYGHSISFKWYYELIWCLFCLSWIFIIIPWIANMRQLIIHEAVWCDDPMIGNKITSWLIDWSIFLNLIAATSGSAFGSVEFCNSNLFSYDPLCMGLNERHIKKFNNGRLTANIWLENIPQIIIQITWGLFISPQGWKSQILWIAIFTSFASIVVMAADILASRGILNTKKDGVIEEILCIKMQIKSAEIESKSKRLQITTYSLRDGIAKILTIPSRSIEMHFPLQTNGGLEISFTIRTNKISISDLMTIIDDGLINDSQDFAHCFKEKWRLKQLPEIENVEKNIRDNHEFEIIQQNLSRLRARSSILRRFIKMKKEENSNNECHHHQVFALKNDDKHHIKHNPTELIKEEEEYEYDDYGDYDQYDADCSDLYEQKYDLKQIEYDRNKSMMEQKMDQPINDNIDYNNIHHQLSMFSQSQPHIKPNKKDSDIMTFPTVPSSKQSIDKRSNSVLIPKKYKNIEPKLKGLGIKKIQFSPKKQNDISPHYIINNNYNVYNENDENMMEQKSMIDSMITDDSYADQLKLNEEIKYKKAQFINKQKKKNKLFQSIQSIQMQSTDKGYNNNNKIKSIKRLPAPNKVPPPKPNNNKNKLNEPGASNTNNNGNISSVV